MRRPKSDSVSSDTGSILSMRRFKSRDSSEDPDSDGRKRNRITLACGRCRMRKIRCDGQPVCKKCITVGHKCEYTAVTKEENLMAREKKAASKANRAKVPRFTAPKLSAASLSRNSKKGEPADKAKSAVALTIPANNTISFDVQQIHHAFNTYSQLSPVTDSSIPEDALEVDEHLEMPSLYFDYGSSSTSSLPNEYDSGYMAMNDYGNAYSLNRYHDYEETRQYSPVGYSMPNALFAQQDLANTIYRKSPSTEVSPYQMSRAHSLTQDPHMQQIPSLPFPTVAAGSPSGLCLYIPGSSVVQSPTMSTSSSINGYTQSHYSPLPSPSPTYAVSPRVYHGPIDWSARPLAPYAHSTSVNPHCVHPLQTVRLDQICATGL